MTEEKKEDNEEILELKEKEIVTQEEEHEEEPSPVEIAAREKGWKPAEEYEGDPESWVDAKEFIAREPLYKALHKVNRELKKQKEETTKVKQLYDRIELTAKEKAMKELQQQLRVAAEEKDIEAALAIKDKINELSEPAKSEAPKNDIFDNWVVNNEWYEQDEDLRDFADGKGAKILAKNPDMPLEQVYEEVTKSVKKVFPNKFMNPLKERASAVDSGKQIPAKSTGGRKKEVTYDDLPIEVQDVYRKMVKKDATHPRGNDRGILSHAEFIKDYLAVGGTVNTGA